MKMFRRVEPGPNPDVEIGEFLPHAASRRVPPLRGALSYVRDGRRAGRRVAMLQGYV